MDDKLVVRHCRTIYQSQQRQEQHDDPAYKLDCRGNFVKSHIAIRLVHVITLMSRRYLLETTLILAVLVLTWQLIWPMFSSWQRSPSPGAVGLAKFEEVGLAPEHLIYLPSQYGNGAYLLVVYLHGAGERGSNPELLRLWGPFAAIRSGLDMPAIVAAPLCLRNNSWSPESVKRFIEHIATNYGVNREQIYLIRFSMGGFATWRTAATYPELFAAVVPIAGGGDTAEAESLAAVPLWAFHGANDETVPLAKSEQMIKAIQAVGGTQIDHRPGCRSPSLQCRVQAI